MNSKIKGLCPPQTETDYILSSENNKNRLEESIAQYNNGSVVVKSVVELNKSNDGDQRI